MSSERAHRNPLYSTYVCLLCVNSTQCTNGVLSHFLQNLHFALLRIRVCVFVVYLWHFQQVSSKECSFAHFSGWFIDSTFMCFQLYCLLYCVPHIVETSLIHLILLPTSQCVLYGEVLYWNPSVWYHSFLITCCP